MKIIKKYLEDQSIIKMEIEEIKQKVGGTNLASSSPKVVKNKRPSSVSKTTDKKSNAKWDGTISERKAEAPAERERIMTATEANKSGKSFQKISDLKEKLRQFEMINDKFQRSKKEKS